MTQDHHEEEPHGKTVRRWLYAGLGAVVLLAGGTAVVRTGAVPRALGLAQAPGATQEADARKTRVRETFEEDIARLGPDGVELASLSIPTDAKGYFAPPLESEMPDGEDGASIRRGRDIFLNPGANATDYVGNALACANCHLNAGRLANAAPMWAASGVYPKYRSKNDQINTMEDRITGCFTYSMNAQDGPTGGPPPQGDPIYKDVESYIHWLATGAPNRVDLPGAGYPALDEPAMAYDETRAKATFDENCSVCHGSDGQGRQDQNGRYAFPPLWGPHSYNGGAGMSRVSTAAGFIYANMPIGKPYSLTEQEAWDVAGYINAQDRPIDPRKVTDADAPVAPAGPPSASGTGTVVPAN